MRGEGQPPGVIDPREIGTRQEFADQLSLLKDQAGLTVREIAGKAGVPASTLGGYFAGTHLPPVKMSDLLLRVLSVCGVDNDAEIGLWLAALTRVRRAPGKRPAGALVPYRGLESFQPDDAPWFFGRQRLTGILLGQLRDQYRQGGLLAVIGASGSGKSSLLRAGLIPAIRDGELAAGDVGHRPSALFTPGTHPMAELNRHQDAMTAEAGEPSVIVVDQFEEVFTQCQAEQERRDFIQALCAAAAAGPDGRSPEALIVVGLRADFYPHALRYPEMVAELERRQVLIGPMTHEELRSVITGPARKAGLDIETGLTEILLRDLTPLDLPEQAAAAHEPGTLPLLSHALLATWDLSRGGRLTVADYRASDGIQGAVAASAEDVYTDLTPAQRDLARRVFTRLVHVADDTADTRRRVSRAELQFGGADVQHVLDAFIDRRLITANVDTVEIAHEALLRAWPRLRHWIDADNIGVRVHRQLTAAAEEWRDSGNDPGALYRGGRLASAEEWASTPAHSDDLNQLERAFLSVSIAQRQQAESAARRQANRLRAFSASLAILLIAAASLAVLAYQQRSSAISQRDVAVSRQVAVEANQLRGTDIALAMQLSLAAFRISPTEEAVSSLLNSTANVPATRLLGPRGTEMHAVAFSPDGSVLATGSGDGSVRLWDVRTAGRPVRLGPAVSAPGSVTSVAFSPDGKTLATSCGAAGAAVWDVSDPRRPALRGRIPAASGDGVTAIAFSPDGRTLATGSEHGRIRMWKLAGLSGTASLGSSPGADTAEVNAVAFSPNGQLVAAGTADGKIIAWPATAAGTTSGPGLVIDAIAHVVNAIAFSPDGRVLASAGNDSMVRRWSIVTASRAVKALPPLSGPKSWAYALAFSPDGRSIAAGSADDNVYIWTLEDDTLTATLPQPAPVTSLAWDARGGRLATADANDVARIWVLPGPVLAAAPGSVFAAAFGPGAPGRVLAVASAPPDGRGQVRLWNVADPARPVALGSPLTAADALDGTVAYGPGGRLAAGSADGTVQLWDVRTAARPVRLPSPPSSLKTAIQNVAFDSTGRLLAAGSTDGTVEIWNTSSLGHAVPLASLADANGRASDQDVFAVAFSPDGHLLAAANANGTVRLWDIANPARPEAAGKPLIDLSDAIYQVTFSPDGHLLAASGEDGNVRLWDVATPRLPRLLATLGGSAGTVYDVTFSPDGRTIATSNGDNTVTLWNVADPVAPARFASLTGPAGTVFAAVFSPDGSTLAAGSQDATARLWRATPGAAAAYVCDTVGAPITRAEWAQYIPGRPYDPPCQAGLTRPPS
jgi:WD40 repeat protein